LILGLVAFLSSVGPLEKRVFELEAHGLARDIDSVVNVRVAAIRIAMGEIGHDELSEAGELDTLLSSFRRTFRDFLSLEVLDKRGEVMAMAGELPLSQARRFSRTDESTKSGKTALSRSEEFQDNPKAKDFIITVKHTAKDGAVWYSRTRFSRDSIERILSSGHGQWQSRLVKDSGEEANAGTRGTITARSFGDWWGGLDTAEASLQTPGWIVKLDRPSKRVLLSKGPIIFVALFLLVAVLACLYRRHTSDRRAPLPGQVAVTRPEYNSREETVVRASEHRRSFCVKASGWDDSRETDREDCGDHDVWTPRNVPIGIVESLEPDAQLATPVPTAGECDEEHPESLETAEQSPLEEQKLNEPDPGALSTVSDVGDFPETIELTWFEPADLIADSGEPRETDSSPAVPEAETRMVAIPDSLEVSWSEPKGDKSEDLLDERARNQPPRYYNA